ncbi:hypothetical protein ANCDUO_09832, partial [Ancylostoma duodenale]
MGCDESPSDSMANMNVTIPPYIAEWFQQLPVVYIVFIGVCACVFVAIIVATAILVWRIHYYVPNEYVQADLYFIVLVPFIVSGVCLIGNIIPRAAPVMYAVGLVFLMLCLHITVLIIIRLFGTRNGMAKWLLEHNKVLHLGEVISAPFRRQAILLLLPLFARNVTYT